MVASAISKNPKSGYPYNGLTYRHELWHVDAIRHLWCIPRLQILKNRNIVISRTQFQRFQRQLARRRCSAPWPFGPFTHLKFKKIKMAAANILTNLKLRYFSKGLTDWRMLALQNIPAVEISNFQKLKIADGRQREKAKNVVLKDIINSLF